MGGMYHLHGHASLGYHLREKQLPWDDPRVHIAYLKQQNADIIGFQEVNKGHTSSAYMDLFRYYQHHLIRKTAHLRCNPLFTH